MIKIIFLVICIVVGGCGVKNDVIPPEKPWIIFESPKKMSKKILKKKKTKGEKKDVIK